MIEHDVENVRAEITLENWQTAKFLRWTFQNTADVLSTATISRGNEPPSLFPAVATPLSGIAIPPIEYEPPFTVGDVIGSTDTDGWAVARNGTLLTEQYFGGMTTETSHLLMSVSKSIVGAVVGILNGAGLLDIDAPVCAYVPALASSGYAGATVRHLLDMRSGIAFSEDYLDPASEVRLIEQAIDWAPRSSPEVPRTMYDFLSTLQRKADHGGPFEYRSCETDVLGWICEAATGTRMPELISDTLWSRIGAENDAIIGIDSVGTGMFDGGISACLRDLIRFGSLYLNGGIAVTGKQVVPAAWISDTFAGGLDSRSAFALSPGDNRMPGGMYRNQCWFPYEGSEVLLCLGIHGQMIYVNRTAGIVAAKLSAWPLPQDASKLFPTIRAFDAIAAEFT